MRMQLVPWLLCAVGVALAAPAQEIWTASLGAPAAHAPLIADVHESPGPEVVVVLTTGQVRLYQADGQSLWTAELAAPLAVGAQSALSAKGDLAPSGLAVPLATSVQYLNAATGAVLWKSEVAGAKWLLSSDLNDDKIPDVVALAADGTLTALDGNDGATLWDAHTKLSAASVPPALADIDDDGFPEIFVAGNEGLEIFDAQGMDLSFTELEKGSLSAPVVGDLDDGIFEVYLVLPGGTLAAYEADTGEVLWETKLTLADTPVPVLALADLDQNEKGDIIVAGSRTYVIAADGKQQFESDATGLGLAVADANSDGELEVVLSGASMTMLDAALGPVTEITLDTPSRFAPVVAAISGVALLSVGDDNALRVTRTGARLMPQLAPWPQPRRDASGRAGCLSPLLEMDRHADGPQLAASNAPLAFAGGFEEAETAWQTDSGNIALDATTKSSGEKSLRMVPAAATALHATSPVAEASPSLRRISASVLGKGIARVEVVWQRADGTTTSQELRPADITPEGWQRYRISNAPKPAGARTLHLAFTIDAPEGETAYLDDVQATGDYLGVPYVEVFSNLLGYELRAPKNFTAAATFPTVSATFRILGEGGVVVHESGMGAPSRMVGANATDWGKFYWRGDFSTLDEPGRYQIEIDIDGNKARSPQFEIAHDLYWDRLFLPLVTALTGFRAEVGSGRAWRSPDPVDDVNTLRALNEIYAMLVWRLVDPSAPASPAVEHPLLQEIRWGAEQLLDRTEPGPALAAALAGTARLLPEEKAYAEAARKLIAAHANDEAANLDLFCAVLDLYVATKDDSLRVEAERRYPGPEPSVLDSLVRYEAQVDDMMANSFAASAMLGAQSDAFAKSADNPFGLVPREEASVKNYLNAPPKDAPSVDAGNLDQILSASVIAAKVYRFNAKPEYRTLILDQYNWILGNNPVGVSLFNGLGLPDVKGAAGTVSDAIRAAAPGEDRPALYADVPASNLRHTVAFLEALANLKRIRTSGPTQP